jgi:predicted O-methyltransferase YrrM
MSQELWSSVDQYISQMLTTSDTALEAALADSEKAGLPSINVSPPHGKLLHLLARAILMARGPASPGAILEIGTLGGYSTIWLARALPRGGRLITLEYDSKHAEVARANVARAGLNDVVEIRMGKAIDSLPALAKEGRGPFDLIFIDADKQSYAEYFEWAVKLSRTGTVIIADNVVRKGEIANAQSTDASVQGMRRFTEMAGKEPRVAATCIQTVGAKGYDGFVIARVVR